MGLHDDLRTAGLAGFNLKVDGPGADERCPVCGEDNEGYSDLCFYHLNGASHIKLEKTCDECGSYYALIYDLSYARVYTDGVFEGKNSLEASDNTLAADGGIVLDFGEMGYGADFEAVADVPEAWSGFSSTLRDNLDIWFKAYDTSLAETPNEQAIAAKGLAFECFVFLRNHALGSAHDIELARFTAADRGQAEQRFAEIASEYEKSMPDELFDQLFRA